MNTYTETTNIKRYRRPVRWGIVAFCVMAVAVAVFVLNLFFPFFTFGTVKHSDSPALEFWATVRCTYATKQEAMYCTMNERVFLLEHEGKWLVIDAISFEEKEDGMRFFVDSKEVGLACCHEIELFDAIISAGIDAAKNLDQMKLDDKCCDMIVNEASFMYNALKAHLQALEEMLAERNTLTMQNLFVAANAMMLHLIDFITIRDCANVPYTVSAISFVTFEFLSGL